MGTIQVIRQNMISNTKAGLNTTGWSISGANTSLAQSTSVGRSGTTSFAATQSAAPTGMAISQSGLLTTRSGVYWAFTAYAKTASGTHTCYASVKFLDGGGFTLLSANSSNVSVGSGAWSKLSRVAAVAPVGTVYLRPSVEIVNTTAPTTVYVTDMCLEMTNTGTHEFFDGDSADQYFLYATLDYGWFGTANASSSFAEFGIASAQNLGSVLDGPDVLGF